MLPPRPQGGLGWGLLRGGVGEEDQKEKWVFKIGQGGFGGLWDGSQARFFINVVNHPRADRGLSSVMKTLVRFLLI
jgi:hypothetical protein